MPPTLLFILLMMLTFAIAFYFLRPTKTESEVQKRLDDITDSRLETTAAGVTILKEEGYSSNPEISAIVKQIPGAFGTLNLIRQAGQTWAVSTVMAISLLSTALVAWIASYFLPSIIFPVLAGMLAGSAPYIYLVVQREIRFRKCDQLLPEAIDL